MSPGGQVQPTVDENWDLEGLRLSTGSNPEELRDFHLPEPIFSYNMGIVPPIFILFICLFVYLGTTYF